MIRYIFGGLVFIGIAFGAATGQMEAVSAAMIDGAAKGAQICLSMLGAYCLWLGLFEIAKQSGLLQSIAKKAEKIIGKLFPRLRGNAPAMGAIALNLVANMLGMGNAATPFGLKAMAELQKQNPTPKRATHEMCLFLIINTASVQLLPLTILALRSAAGSAAPGEIIPTAFLATLGTALFGIFLSKICAKKGGGK